MKWTERVAELLFGPEIPVRAEVADGILPPRVRIRGGRWLPRLGGIMGRMRGPAAAVTIGRTIVVHPDVQLSRRLLKHELEHVRQWEEDLLFPLRYAAESLRVGYRQNRYERMARAAEHDPSFPDPLEDLA